MRQQRNQDSSAIYKPKDSNQTTPPDPQSTTDSPLSQYSSSFQSNTSSPSPTIYGSSNQHSPISPVHNHSDAKYTGTNLNGSNIPNQSNNSNGIYSNGSIDLANNSITNNGIGLKSPNRATEKPVQKVIPSRNSTPIKYHQVTSPTNGNQPNSIDGKGNSTKEYGIYVKPTSPTKPLTNTNGSPASVGSAVKSNGNTKLGQKNTR